MATTPSTIIRAAVSSYVNAAAIANLVKIYADPPFDTSDIPYDSLLAPGSTMACIGIVYIDSDDDRFVAMDGAGGERIVKYQISLELMGWDVSGEVTGATQLMDNIIDAVKYRLREDPRLGTLPPNPPQLPQFDIIQAAVSKLYVERGRPVRPGNGNTWVCWAAVHFALESYEYST